jgi:mannitol 2-dehydrogenase
MPPLASPDTRVARPSYDRAAVTVGSVHFGVGGFFRSHQAMYLDRLMNRGLALDWGVCAIGSLPRDRRIIDTLAAQDGLYTLVVVHPTGRREPRVIGSIVETMFGPDDPGAVAERLADPRIRIVSLTITEGGYGTDPPSPAFVHIVDGLALRRQRGSPPFAVMSCDNLPHNGALARRVACAVALDRDADLATWIDAEVAFPSSMVDRITPVTTPADVDALADEFGVQDGWPVICEDFAQWVLEDRFPLGRPPLEEAGVQLVDDVGPYELMKLRLLNAGHQAVAYLAFLAGHRYVHEACQDPLFADLLSGYMDREGTPTLPPVPGIDLETYRRDVVRRFANPHIADTLARICTDGSDRIGEFLVPVIRANLQRDGDVRISALVVAGWELYSATVDELADRNRDDVVAAARAGSVLSLRDVFGELGDDQRFVSAHEAAQRALRELGVRRAIEIAVRSP